MENLRFLLRTTQFTANKSEIRPPSERLWYLVLIFGIGFISLIYEIYSTSVVFFFFSETNWAITIGITSFLAGIAFSSLFFSSFVKKKSLNAFFLIWIMQFLISFYGYFFLRQYDLIPQTIDYFLAKSINLSLLTSIKIILIWLYLFIPAFFIGGCFPLVNGLFLQSWEDKTKDTGIVYFWDTFGSLAGGLITGLWLIPRFGFQWTCIIAVYLNLIVGIVVAPKKVYKAITALFFLYISFMNFSYTNVSLNNPYPYPNVSLNNPYLNKRFGTILFQKNSPYGVVTIGNNAFGIPNDKALFINYRDMCHSQYHPSESAVGQLTTAQLPEHSSVLNIGLGCGFTADAIAINKNLKHLDIVEINPVVAEGTAKYFQGENGNVINNVKTKLIIQDGSEYVRNTKKIYNAVVIDIEEPTIVDSSPLYTSDYFHIMHNKLAAGGILSLWTFQGNTTFEKIIYNTLKNNFKFVYIRFFAGFLTFYASDNKYSNLLPADTAESEKVDAIVGSPNTDINTLDHRVLEKYSDIQQVFDFPPGYIEPSTGNTK